MMADTKKSNAVDVAANVFAHRLERGWNQSDLARHSGVAHSTINNLENYRRKPSMTTLHKLAMAFGVPVADLLSEETPTIERDGKLIKLGRVLPPSRKEDEADRKRPA